MTKVLQIILGTPEAAMNDHHDGKLSAGFWHSYLAELVGITAVGEASIRRGWRQSQNIIRGHEIFQIVICDL